MLEEEGQYSSVCKDSFLMMCPQRAERLSQIFATAAFLVNGISLPSGIFLDRFGGRAVSGENSSLHSSFFHLMFFHALTRVPRLSSLCYASVGDSAAAMLFTIVGLLMVGASNDAPGEDYFVSGYAVLAVGGQLTLFAVFPTAFEVRR